MNYSVAAAAAAAGGGIHRRAAESKGNKWKFTMIAAVWLSESIALYV